MAAFDLNELRRAGVVVIKDFFEPEMKARLAALGGEISDRIRDGHIGRDAQMVTGMQAADVIDMGESAALLDVAHQVLGPDICCLVSRVLMKDKSFGDAIQAHQDWPYFGGNTHKLNVFVPLTHCRRENGMIVFYRGSHTAGPVERGAIDVDRFPHFEPVCPDIDVGDVLLADFLTWHSSVPAVSDDDRILLQVTLQPASDRSSNIPFGGPPHDFGPIVTDRFAPMKQAVPTVGVNILRQLIAANRLDEANAIASGLAVDSPDHVEAHLARYELARLRGEDGLNELSDADQAIGRLAARLEQLKPPAPEPDAATAAPADGQPQAGSWSRRVLKRLVPSL